MRIVGLISTYLLLGIVALADVHAANTCDHSVEPVLQVLGSGGSHPEADVYLERIPGPVDGAYA